MRTLNLNGYIDEEVWYGDEITPAMLHDALYGENEEFSDDVCIILNSYGGSCNAATRMHDDIRAYPGKVHLVISGTAASAATVLSMAADTLEMTPGSLYMIHDPSTFAWGNERDFNEAIMLLRACKESILNIYACRCPLERGTVSAMMTATTWMDAGSALAHGFIDAVADPQSCPANSARAHVINRKDAEAKVQVWLDRHKPQTPRPTPGIQNRETPVIVQAVPETTPAESELEASNQETESVVPGIPADQLHKRLNLIKPNDR
ncbi:MAG: Clp protease ClpP [Clostridia bacterium]|nr:Clp protease ClpP [Clostridia bacterium]